MIRNRELCHTGLYSNAKSLSRRDAKGDMLPIYTITQLEADKYVEIDLALRLFPGLVTHAVFDEFGDEPLYTAAELENLLHQRR